MLNLIQHLTKSRTYETLKQVQGDKAGLFTRPLDLRFQIFQFAICNLQSTISFGATPSIGTSESYHLPSSEVLRQIPYTLESYISPLSHGRI
jgi:hypothetical protein